MDTRRNFLVKGALGAAGLTLSNVNHAWSTGYGPEKASFNLGIAGYSFVHFKLEEALKMMKKVNVNYLCIKDFHIPFKSSTEEIALFHQKLKDFQVSGYAVGPIYMKTKSAIDDAFEYARRVGVNLIIGIPEHQDLAYVSEKVKETNIRYAIHNHGPEDKLYPNAGHIYNLIKQLDPGLGICFDMGHHCRDGHDPIADLKKFSHRIFDIHLKNVTAATKDGTTCELGRGVIDIPAFVKTLNKVKYSGVCSLEYEKDMKDPLAGIAESVGYFKGVRDVG